MSAIADWVVNDPVYSLVLLVGGGSVVLMVAAYLVGLAFRLKRAFWHGRARS